ncbi:MAG: alpha-D-glucose phosphate-specific phosphoglucomutase [Pseudomonadota bacterium]
MTSQRIAIAPFEGQKPGTSGLRKKTKVFLEPHYLESFVQAIFDATGGAAGKTYVLGGDGRYHNDRACQTILKIAAANGAARVIVGQGGILSTPAASHLIRLHQTDGGIILSASHNPGGPDEDFGIKFNTPNGGPAPEQVTEAIHAATGAITGYQVMEAPDLDLAAIGPAQLGEMRVDVVDPVADYADLMETLFDFAAIKALIAGGFRLTFDAMNAVTGPYAVEILENRLGAAAGTVTHRAPLPDFGGMHPDPNPVWAEALMTAMYGEGAPDFGAASDGDGDRNMIVGPRTYVSPSDSLAIIAANAHLAPGYKAGLKGVARSMPTSCALDAVAKARGRAAFETPTGWKFFGNLMDAGRVSLCGEESFGTGSDHVREKDGLWAVLMWLNILAVRQISLPDLVADHFRQYGRHYYSRHDFEGIDSAAAARMLDDLTARLPLLEGAEVADMRVAQADIFTYHDPVDGSVSGNQGYRIGFDDGARVVLRLSGTGTSGATLRVYLERFVAGPEGLDDDPQHVLQPVIAAAHALTNLAGFTGRTSPDVIT